MYSFVNFFLQNHLRSYIVQKSAFSWSLPPKGSTPKPHIVPIQTKFSNAFLDAITPLSIVLASVGFYILHHL